jgi:hypothetical protein
MIVPGRKGAEQPIAFVLSMFSLSNLLTLESWLVHQSWKYYESTVTKTIVSDRHIHSSMSRKDSWVPTLHCGSPPSAFLFLNLGFVSCSPWNLSHLLHHMRSMALWWIRTRNHDQGTVFETLALWLSRDMTIIAFFSSCYAHLWRQRRNQTRKAAAKAPSEGEIVIITSQHKENTPNEQKRYEFYEKWLTYG